jgi:hypothetical protein
VPGSPTGRTCRCRAAVRSLVDRAQQERKLLSTLRSVKTAGDHGPLINLLCDLHRLNNAALAARRITRG